jgi:hypothetical protein
MTRMGKLNDLQEVRGILHNNIDFAMGERLRSIKEALPAFWPNRPENKVKRTRSQTSATVSVSDLRLDMPMTPTRNVEQSANGDVVAAKREKRKLAEVSQLGT